MFLFIFLRRLGIRFWRQLHLRVLRFFGTIKTRSCGSGEESIRVDLKAQNWKLTEEIAGKKHLPSCCICSWTPPLEKSHLLRSLVTDEVLPSVSCPDEEGFTRSESTTYNVNYFLGLPLPRDQQHCISITKVKWAPPYLKMETKDRFQDFFPTKATIYFEVFPKLAYSMSNVVILVSREDSSSLIEMSRTKLWNWMKGSVMLDTDPF